MKYLSILLEGFKCFPLRNGAPFYHEFKQKLTMVVGRNGAGKSSLLNQLTPLPPDKSLFYPGKGYQKLVVEKDKHIFELIADFKDGSTYNFIMDGVELNTAGLITAQRELVYKYFGITQVVHDIMVDREQFSTMSLTARKKLFNTITHMNIDSVIDGFNKLKEELKNNQLLYKSATTNLINEEAKLLTKEDREFLEKDLANLKQKIDELFTIRQQIQRYSIVDLNKKAYTEYRYVSDLVKTYIETHGKLLTAYPYKDLPRYKERNTARLAAVTTKLNSVYSNMEEQQRRLESMLASSAVDLDNLRKEMETYSTSISRITAGLTYFSSADEVTDEVIGAAMKIEVSLPELVRTMLPNVGLDGERVYTVTGYNESVEYKNKLTKELQENLSLELSIKNHLENISTISGNIECPSCNHSWSAKDALLHSNKHTADLDEIRSKQINLKTSIASFERSLEECREYFNSYRQVMSIRKETEHLLPKFWSEVNDSNYLITEPDKLTSFVGRLITDISSVDQIKTLQRELSYLERNHSSMSVIEFSDKGTILDLISCLEEEAIDLQEEKDHLSEESNTLRIVTERYEGIAKLERELNIKRKDVQDFNIDNLIGLLTTTVDDEIRDLRVSVINCEKDLHRSDTIQYGIDRCKAEIVDLQENIKVLELAIKELCPKTGLIAMSVSSFLNTIIHNVNHTVGNVWDYKMELKEIDVGVDPLNYKFKVTVEDVLDISDISVVSSGMKEIINIAFKQVLYRLLGFDGYPFYFDEAGVKLDTLHRSKFFHMLFSFVADTTYGQIIMITHIDNAISTHKDVEIVEV